MASHLMPVSDTKFDSNSLKKRIFMCYAFKYKFYLKISESFLDHTQLMIFFTQILLGRDSLTQSLHLASPRRVG